MMPATLIAELKKKHGDNWLHVLSKSSHYSEEYITETLEYHKNSHLPKHLEEDFLSAIDIDESIINSHFEILEIVEDYRSGDINYIVIKFKDVEIKLDFYNGKMVPTLNDCFNYLNNQKATGAFAHMRFSQEKHSLKSVENWQSVLQTCEDENISFITELQNQLNYLNKAVVYAAPCRLNRTCSIQSMKNSARLLYVDRSQKARYIQVSAHGTENLTFLA